MSRPLAPGDTIHGYAYGVFGRDHYECVRIEAVGPDWIVTRDIDDGPGFVAGRRSLEFVIRARDEKCPNDDPCPLGQALPPLTTYGS